MAGRDRHTYVEWGIGKRSRAKGRMARPSKEGRKDFGYCDHGWELQTTEERVIYDQLKAEGYTVHKHGWPDFMAVKGDDVRLIEVKGSADRRRESQIAVHTGLKMLGVEVETIIIENPNRPRRIHEKPTPLQVKKKEVA